ncbi:ATPase, histidine kinase-, DNA gyrase B-, and HSP90-like domain protein [Verrucomicrobiia bacterium DG1235]|nr:ATPase, histidine kinase-, DNA gyrase B-, and HSP90-like domain protein [Verrucomicrobiae bacterium DG1235]
MKSFRIRIIIWTIVIAGAVMLGFGVAGNIAYEHAKRSQLDDSLSLVAERFAPPPNHSRFWDRAGVEWLAEVERRFGAGSILAVYGRSAKADEANASDGGEYEMRSWGDLPLIYADLGELPEVKGDYGEFQIPRGGPAFGPSSQGGGFGRRDRGRQEAPRPEVGLLSRKSEGDGSRWRVALAQYEGFNLLVAVNLEAVMQDSALMRRSFAIAFPIALLALGTSIWFFVTKAISPVRRLSNTIERVSAKSLGARLESAGEYSEFASLIYQFNGMLERLERSFAQATRFSADAAHELKTPLTILQGQLEVALQAAPDGSGQQDLLAGLLDETHRLKSITRKLLILAKADAGSLEIQSERVDMRSLTEELVQLAREDVPDAILSILADGEEFVARCDPTLSRQILDNLIGNALKYRHPLDRVIEVSLRADDRWIAVEVTNACAPIDADARERIFDRFVRGDAARNRSEEGTGLGLSLSLEFARAQGGELRLVESSRLEELRICLKLPRFRAVSAAD